MHTIAIIAARGGSKGVPGKNLQRVGGVPLVVRTILAARSARSISATYVTTDDSAIAMAAKRQGAQIISRPAEISGDTASSESAIIHALDTLRSDGRPDPDAVAFLQCTSPFTTGQDVDRVVGGLGREDVACALAVADDHSFLWRRDEKGFGIGLNHDHTRQRQRRQDLPPSFRETGAIYAFRTARFRDIGRVFCGPLALVPLSTPSIDIDTHDDLAIARALAGLFPASVGKAFAGMQGLAIGLAPNSSDSATLARVEKAGIRVAFVVGDRDALRPSSREGFSPDCVWNAAGKEAAFREWVKRHGLDMRKVVFLGSDGADLGCLMSAGLGAAPDSSDADILAVADYVTAPSSPSPQQDVCERLLENLSLAD